MYPLSEGELKLANARNILASIKTAIKMVRSARAYALARATDIPEALKALLLSSRKVSDGVEIVALPPGAEAPEGDYAALHSDRRVKERRSAERRSDTSANDLAP